MDNKNLNDVTDWGLLNGLDSSEQPLVTAYQVGMNSNLNTVIPIDSSHNIVVPPGYHWSDTQDLKWNISIDKSKLKLNVHYVEFNRGTSTSNTGMQSGYQVRLIGPVFHNVVLSGLVPNTPMRSNNSSILFNHFQRSYLNEDLGYVANYEVIGELAAQNIQIAPRFSNLMVTTSTGEVVQYNSSDPTAFYSLFNGRDSISLGVQLTLLVAIGGTLNS